MSFHEGELAVQARAGVSDLAARVGRIINDTIPPAAVPFLAAQRVAIAATLDGDARVWTSLLVGAPGFARAIDERTLVLAPLARNEVFAGPIGVLVIDFAARRRMRFNGIARFDGDAIVVTTREVYGNCPQYITPQDVRVPRLDVRASGDALSAEQQAWIRGADTFFIGTAHPERGADASHRGGRAGFVRADAQRVAWDDFPGNNMFNTLGNLAVNPRCGLLFTDFARTLQLSGTAEIRWDGSERSVEMRIERVSESRAESP
ncbi:MAG: pyridoxamine 5'-phosphate oxidase family protein [Acidobacteria bacterium]|nr:pyridoxamine 5'-phosphate oxidase family protein [Acidobacteriota bacterium]MBV9479039.1 pyridoxamine 5'-phosphate oxidase family protein [Acidobacteriota bacterium]